MFFWDIFQRRNNIIRYSFQIVIAKGINLTLFSIHQQIRYMNRIIPYFIFIIISQQVIIYNPPYMQIDKYIQLDCNPDKSIFTQNKALELNCNLRYKVCKEESICQFYNSNMSEEIQRYLIKPLSIVREKDYYVIVYEQYGKGLDMLESFQYQEIADDRFLRQLAAIFLELVSLKPKIQLGNVYYLKNHPPKLLITSLCIDNEEYRKSIKEFLKIIYKNKANNLELIKKIKKIQDLSQFSDKKVIVQQGKTIKELIELKPQKNTNNYKIILAQDQLNWIFTSLGFKNQPKYELIYNGLQNNYDPSLLLKNINNYSLLYFIQTTKRQKFVFYQPFKVQFNSLAIFGTYYPDKSKKSIILGLNNKTIHQLQDESHAVGYGHEILLAIGKLDIIISAFNVTNVCYFPVSYSLNKQDSQQLFLDRDFKVQQFQAYKLL